MKKTRSIVPSASKQSPTVPAAPATRTNLNSLTLAAMLMAVVVGVQITIGCWGTWLQRPMLATELEGRTAGAKNSFHPDYDMRIYVLGSAFTLALALGVNQLWRRCLDRIRDEDRLAQVRLLLLAHIPAAGATAILPMFWSGSSGLNFAAGCLGLIFCGTTLWAADSPSPLAAIGRPRWPKAAYRSLEAVLVIALLVLLLYVPDLAQVSAWLYQLDHFAHWDFYVMAPALAYRHGAALGTDIYSQYGVGWPVLVAWLSRLTPLSYKLAVHVCMLWHCVYFSALYFFIRALLRSTGWALTGVLLALLVQFFSGTDLPKLVYPSSTVMRYSADVFLLATCLAYARRGHTWLALPTGTFAALIVLFSTDVGIFVLICLGFFLVAVQRVPCEGSRPRRAGWFALFTVLSFVAVSFTGLAVASRGTLLHAEFWSGWTEPLRLYGDGQYHLPVGDAVWERDAYALLLLMLGCYLFTLGRMLDGLYRKTLTADGFLLGVIALYGLAIFTWFIGRSHPFNLHHAAIPFCVLATSYLAGMHGVVARAAEQFPPSSQRTILIRILRLAPGGCAGLVLIGLLVCPGFTMYPSLLRWGFRDRLVPPLILAELDVAKVSQNWKFPDRGVPPHVPDKSYLFVSRRDAPLPDRFQPVLTRFHEVTQAMRTLSANGSKTVAMIDVADTHYLVEADLRPYFHYSPVLSNMSFWNQVAAIERQLVEGPPDYLLFPSAVPRDLNGTADTEVYERILKTITDRFVFEGRIYDIDVYRRKPKG